MKYFRAVRDDDEIFFFTCVTGTDFYLGTFDGNYLIGRSPWPIPSDLILVPARSGATTTFENQVNQVCRFYNPTDLINHSFYFDDTHWISFGESANRLTFHIGDREDPWNIPGYSTIPYCDSIIQSLVSERPFINPGGFVEFNWYADEPNVARIYSGAPVECFPNIRSSSINTGFLYEFWNALNPDSPPDPYSEGGNTGTGGGTGTFSGTGDAISIPSLPTLSATSAGFITLFNPSAAQMASLAAYMWSGAFDLESYRKIFADPMDCILGLSIVPVDVPAGASAEVKVGNIGTGIYMTTAASQYVEVDCGTLDVEEFWGAYLDYDPYTKAEIYLPYIGAHPIAVDDIMGKSVHVVYHVDILSGACVAYIQCGGTVLYSFIGQCSSSIPITGNDWTNVVNGVLSIAGSIGSMVATGGASAPAAVGNIVSTAVNNLKPSVEKSGSLSGTGGMMGIQVPYLILTRPRQALPAKQNAYTGYPSFITENLGTLTGYTEVEEIHLENVPATSGELAEIVSLLKGGVIF